MLTHSNHSGNAVLDASQTAGREKRDLSMAMRAAGCLLSRQAVPEAERGVFHNQRWNPFPLRAAIDIGGGGAVSLCVARVDVRAAAVRDMVYHTQLPVHLDPVRPRQDGAGCAAFAISDRSARDVANKVEVLSGALGRVHRERGGVDERAAVITWPLCLAEDAERLAEGLTRRFKINVQVLGRGFQVAWPLGLMASAQEARPPEAAPPTTVTPSPAQRSGAAGAASPLQALLQQHTAEGGRRPQGSAAPRQLVRAAAPPPTADDMEALAFLAHAAASQCVAPQRLLVVTEDPVKGIRLVGANTTVAEDCRGLEGEGDEDSPQEALRRTGLLAEEETRAPGRLVEHRLDVSVPDAHRLCITRIQHRDAASYHLHRSSPNPMLRSEFAALQELLHGMVEPHLPAWVRRKSLLGGVLAGTSFNGGLLNLAARVSQKGTIPLEHLETHAAHFFCGLTDVLLGENFPHPGVVLPSAALACAMCRALRSPRMQYLPEVSTAVALAVQPGLWRRADTEEGRAQRAAQLAGDPFYQSAAHRVFHRPHIKDNPTAAPGSHWIHNAGYATSSSTAIPLWAHRGMGRTGTRDPTKTSTHYEQKLHASGLQGGLLRDPCACAYLPMSMHDTLYFASLLFPVCAAGCCLLARKPPPKTVQTLSRLCPTTTTQTRVKLLVYLLIRHLIHHPSLPPPEALKIDAQLRLHWLCGHFLYAAPLFTTMEEREGEDPNVFVAADEEADEDLRFGSPVKHREYRETGEPDDHLLDSPVSPVPQHSSVRRRQNSEERIRSDGRREHGATEAPTGSLPNKTDGDGDSLGEGAGPLPKLQSRERGADVEGDEVAQADAAAEEVEGGEREGDTNLVDEAPITMANVNLSDTRRKRLKKVSHYVLGPLLGEGVYGVVRDAIDISAVPQCAAVQAASSSPTSRHSGFPSGSFHGANATHQQFHRCAVKMMPVPSDGHEHKSLMTGGKRHAGDGLQQNRAALLRAAFRKEVENLQRFHCPYIMRGIDLFSRYGKEYIVLPIAICCLQQFIHCRREYAINGQQWLDQANSPRGLKEGERHRHRHRHRHAAEDRTNSSRSGRDSSCEASGSESYLTTSTTGSCSASTSLAEQSTLMLLPTVTPHSSPASSPREAVDRSLHRAEFSTAACPAHVDPNNNNNNNGKSRMASPRSRRAAVAHTHPGSPRSPAALVEHRRPSLFSPTLIKGLARSFYGCTGDGAVDPAAADPEAAKAIDAKACDMWCCGLVLYAMITGRPGPLKIQRLYDEFHHDPATEGKHYPMNRFQLYNIIAQQQTPVDLSDVPHYSPTPAEGSPGHAPAPAAGGTRANSLRDLVAGLLDLDPTKRLTAEQALRHPWMELQFVRRGRSRRSTSTSRTAGTSPTAGRGSALHEELLSSNDPSALSVATKESIQLAVQREVAHRVLASAHFKAMIRRDKQRHLQFVADCCNALDIPLPAELLLHRTRDPSAAPLTPPDGGDAAMGRVVRHGYPEVMPPPCVDPALFLPEADMDYYERRHGMPEFDLRSLLVDENADPAVGSGSQGIPVKVQQFEEYLRNVVMVELGYRTAPNPLYVAEGAGQFVAEGAHRRHKHRQRTNGTEMAAAEHTADLSSPPPSPPLQASNPPPTQLPQPVQALGEPSPGPTPPQRATAKTAPGAAARRAAAARPGKRPAAVRLGRRDQGDGQQEPEHGDRLTLLLWARVAAASRQNQKLAVPGRYPLPLNEVQLKSRGAQPTGFLLGSVASQPTKRQTIRILTASCCTKCPPFGTPHSHSIPPCTTFLPSFSFVSPLVHFLSLYFA
eukprot:gene8589-6029_t